MFPIILQVTTLFLTYKHKPSQNYLSKQKENYMLNTVH